MTDVSEFIEGVLEHRGAYDPVAAREYYLRTRKLKGKEAGGTDGPATEYEKRQIGSAQKQLNADLKKNPKVKMNRKRRIGAAEQKLIRAKSLANRIKDPMVKRDALARLASADKKLKNIKNNTQGLKTGVPKPVLRGSVSSVGASVNNNK